MPLRRKKQGIQGFILSVLLLTTISKEPLLICLFVSVAERQSTVQQSRRHLPRGPQTCFPVVGHNGAVLQRGRSQMGRCPHDMKRLVHIKTKRYLTAALKVG